MLQNVRHLLLTLLSGPLLTTPALSHGTGGDSVRVIGEITVESRIRHHETLTPQTLRAKELELVNAHTVADAMRFMGGVQMKDYGGIGGIKTVNLRSMGSQHVGISYDGIALGNAQNGVIDLGQLSLDNIEEVSLYQGQRSAILQPASDFANAGSIYLRTTPSTQLNDSKKQLLRTRLQVGSSALTRGSLLYERHLSSAVTLTLNGEALASSGRYRFTYRRRNLDGSLAYDTTAIRQNGDVQALRGEANLYGRLDEGWWCVKAYTYWSNRGIPGAIVNNVWRRGERQSDDNTIVQGSYQRDIGRHNTLRASAKYACYATHYLNKDTTQLMVDAHYRQQEAYASLTDVVELAPWWSLSVSYDLRWNVLWTDQPLTGEPMRWSHCFATATAIELQRMKMQASVAGCLVNDKGGTMHSSQQRTSLCPSLHASWEMIPGIQLTGFVKQSFRMPTFNDLYYTNVGNALLKPEKATQIDVGFRIVPVAPGMHHDRIADSERPAPAHDGMIELHAYHNVVNDKIVAYPKGQQFRWTMLNLGRVEIDGIDISFNDSWHIRTQLQILTRLQYTLQRAIDVTDSRSSYYRDQIPYTPWHSGSLTLAALWREWDVAYNFTYTGERYCQQENIRYNHLQPWYTSDMHLSYRHVIGTHRYKMTLEVNNLLDQQYDVIINYPMPGRNFNVTIQCEL